MGHYDEQYEAAEREAAKFRADRLARAKAKHPNDPSQWGISLEERVKMLEDYVRSQGRLR